MTFGEGMDPQSRDIIRNGSSIGFLMWHPHRSPRIILHTAGEHLTIQEMKQCLDEYDRRRP